MKAIIKGATFGLCLSYAGLNFSDRPIAFIVVMLIMCLATDDNLLGAIGVKK